MSVSTIDVSEHEIAGAACRSKATGNVSPQRAVAGAIGVALCGLFAWLFLQTLLHPQRVGSTDFLQEWTSARNWMTGRPVYARLSETLPVYFGPEARCVVDLNAHPPTAVAWALPFGLWPYQQAWMWWNIANITAIAAGLWLLLGNRGLRYSLGGWIAVLLLVLSSNALKEQVQLGQLNGWLLLLLTGAWWSERNGRSALGGACIGAAAAIKLFPGFVILYFLVRRDWKACLSAAGSFAILTASTVAILGTEVYRDYASHVLPTLGQFRTAWLNASVHGFWSRLLIGQPERMIPLASIPGLAAGVIAASCLLVVGGVVLLAATAKSRAGRDRAFAATTIGMLLVSPITWDHYFLLLVPAIAILWQTSSAARWNRLALIMLAIVLLTIRPAWIFGLAIPGPGEFAELLGLPPPILAPWQTLTVLAYPFYALTLLFGMAAIGPTRASRAVQVTAP